MNKRLYALSGSVLGGTIHVVIPIGYYVIESGPIRFTDKMCKGGKSRLRFAGKPEWIAIEPLFYGDEIHENMFVIRPLTSPN